MSSTAMKLFNLMISILIHLTLINKVCSDDRERESHEINLHGYHETTLDYNLLRDARRQRPIRARRTTPRILKMYASFAEDCDYMAYFCFRSYKTGPVCGRSMYYKYQDFDNYCMLDYVNCMERYIAWQIAHVGKCFQLPGAEEGVKYEYKISEDFLDADYVTEKDEREEEEDDPSTTIAG